ncbi:MAG: CocE/NonD family hydrolase [Pirellulaceae bacterium]
MLVALRLMRRKLSIGTVYCWFILLCLSQCLESVGVAQHSNRAYTKTEHRLAMRDGVTLYTAVYSPADKSEQYPILLTRTPYGCNPYGEEQLETLMYNRDLVEAGYIFVFQDLRGRAMSDGDPEFENLKPAYSLADSSRIDEVTDTYDTIEWLLTNVDNHNDRVGIWGHSYSGWTALMGAVSAHPNLKAVLAAAPSIDIFFEDFGRNGLFALAYTPVLDWFGTPKTDRQEGPWWENKLDYWADAKRFGLAKDSYEFFLKKGSLKNFDDLVGPENYFWTFLKTHPNYDEFRQQHNSLQYLQNIQCPVLIVGGWNDEQNLYGFLKSYQTIQSQNPESDCRLVVGPWSHGQHRETATQCYVGNVFFGDDIAQTYQRDFEFRWLESQLRDESDSQLPEASIFDTGTKKWLQYGDYPPKNTRRQRLYLNANETLTANAPEDSDLCFEFISDPAKPVPYVEGDAFSLFPQGHYMTDDQRFASKRPDVLTFVSEPISENTQLVGPLTAHLQFATDQSDADLIVKLIDVYPMDRQPLPSDKPILKMNGYQQLVRIGCIRGRFRESYSHPQPLVAGEPTPIQVELLDVCHTFKPGHRLMIQIQSTMFPLFDRNPQKYVENIF